MLQRIQTVFLFLVSLLMVVDVFSPIWISVNDQTGESHILYSAFHEYIPGLGEPAQNTFWPYAIVSLTALIAAGIAFYEIFQYRDRLNQMKLGALNSIVMTVCLGCSVWFATEGQKEWILSASASYGYGMFLPAAAMIMNIIANRFIRRDEKLVRSVDRIR